MGTTGKFVGKATYGVTGILMKPLYDMIKEERKANDKKYAISMKQAKEDVFAEVYADMQPKKIEVHQQYDSIICDHEFW